MKTKGKPLAKLSVRRSKRGVYINGFVHRPITHVKQHQLTSDLVKIIKKHCL